ncbi:arylesterase [Amaricoccus sp. W119]|uniref:arylesterase n=1 Tax=Amaricoccus sp. W119 TaxID=3391833 RepID=UPI0039A51A0F
MRINASTAWMVLGLFVAAMSMLPVQAATRIIALGDSLTAGYGLPPDEGFVPKLDAWLAANGAEDVEVVNAGVSGDTTAGGLARLDWTLGEPADAMILELGANDMLRGLDPEAARANLDRILDRVTSRGMPVLLAGVPAIGNFGPEYQARFSAMYSELAAEHEAILYPSFFAGLTEGRSQSEARALIQGDGLHPNADGVDAIVEDIGPVVLELVERAQSR